MCTLRLVLSRCGSAFPSQHLPVRISELGDQKLFLFGAKRSICVNGPSAEAYLCQNDLPNNIEPTVFVLGDLGVARKRRESRVRSDGCKPPQPSEVSDLIGRWSLPSYRGRKTQVICPRIVLIPRHNAQCLWIDQCSLRMMSDTPQVHMRFA